MTKPKRIWLIDDDEDESLFFQMALSQLGQPIDYSFHQDSVVALSKVRNEDIPKPDLLFLDLNMPKIGGKDCLKAIRNLTRYASVPIIVYTTSQARHEQEEAERLGASYFLIKQNTVGELTQKLKYLFALDWSGLNKVA